tara:strand:- start:1075 stop:1653 length:579 start_codon:yes stop_codon:yes gene_type:complete
MRFLIYLCCIIFFGCDNYLMPKQSAYLRLDYSLPEYKVIDSNQFPFIFETNNILSNVSEIAFDNESIDFIIKYDELNGQINLQYQKLDSKEKLDTYILDLKKTIETHSIMANSVRIKDYVSEKNKIYGRIFDLSGNVASPYQFYLTDNRSNIIAGFVYFNIKPNYDSILPAINYIENDIINLIESFSWKKNK